MTNSRSRLLAPFAALMLLTGCGQPASSKDGPGVATVASGGPTVSANGATVVASWRALRDCFFDSRD